MKRLLGLAFLLCSLSLSGQQNRSWGLEADYGFLFLHSQDIAPIGQSYPWGFHFNYSKWLLEEKHWDNCSCYPRLGLSLGYHNYDNAEVLGFGIPAYGFLEPWYRLGGRSYFNFRGSLGLAYLSNPYDEQNNPLNLSYSLPGSAFVMLGLGYGYAFNEHWRGSLQIRYNHTSNGGIREPNKGLNYPSVAVGVDYSPKAMQLKVREKKRLSNQPLERSVNVMPFLAGKAGGTTGTGANEQDVTFLVSGVALRYLHQWSRVSAGMLELEGISNMAYERQIEKAQGNEDHRQLALQLGHVFMLGKFEFSQAAGFYLYKEYGSPANWFQRYGLLYYPWPRLGLGPNIRVHGHVAEFIDFRFVYKFAWQ